MIARGQLGEKTYEVHVLTSSDIPAIQMLQQQVIAALPDANILQPVSDEELLFMLNGNGLIIGVYIEEKLIAFRAVLNPAVDEEHLGFDIGLTEDELSSVLYQEISNVHPDYRGFGLQRKMADLIMSQVDVEKYPVICATVMPYNIASLKDKFSQNMHIAALKLKYGGKLRYVFAKYYNKPVSFSDEQVEVEMFETKLQQKLMKDGFLGVEMKKSEKDWVIVYRKFKK